MAPFHGALSTPYTNLFIVKRIPVRIPALLWLRFSQLFIAKFELRECLPMQEKRRQSLYNKLREEIALLFRYHFAWFNSAIIDRIVDRIFNPP